MKNKLLTATILLSCLHTPFLSAAIGTPDPEYTIPVVGKTTFTIDYVVVDGYSHRVAFAGNPDGEPVVIMTGYPEDDLPAARWLVDEMNNHPEGGKYRYILVHVPFLEDYSVPNYSKAPEYKTKYAEYNGQDVKTGKTIEYKGVLPVDPRYDHENQAKAYYSIVRGGLGIEKAHFVGHDRGAVITDYMLGEHPELVLTYSRGSQAWKRFDKEWEELGHEGIFIGPPHAIFATEGAAMSLEKIFNESFPFALSTPSFTRVAALADPKSELGKRFKAIRDMADRPEHYLRVTREMFRQSKLEYEVEQRIDPNNSFSIVNTEFPLMHFQGGDELIAAKDVPGAKLVNEKTQTYKYADLPDKLGYLSYQVSEQPWFGKYNWYEGEIVNLNPDTVYQSPNDPVWKENWDKYVTDHADGTYQTLQTMKDARFDRFAIIPNAVHFSHIENPKASAWAILDFIADSKDVEVSN